jgi:hypothetical protein
MEKYLLQKSSMSSYEDQTFVHNMIFLVDIMVHIYII